MLQTAPMGWNSWDCYGASITEEELLANAQYMKENMKDYGWEYVVCDIQWYEPDAVSSYYRDFVPLEMDEYSRLIPSVKRFPSAKDGVGFKAIADKIHDMGLKFGIHMMRGIPRQAVHANTAIKGSTATAREIAQRFSVCSWNTDMYGVNPNAKGASAYYNSVFELYASWGVDFVKVDDICNTYYSPQNLYSGKAEIELISNAIKNCGRKIVLSLSPGPADIQYKEHLCKYANMWRITADYWDDWEDLSAMFERCKTWQGVPSQGNWPDCDMLPLGHINIRGQEHGLLEPRYTRFTHEEQKTMMSLWCIFRSPLMMGGELRDNDKWTLDLLTNKDIIEMHTKSRNAFELTRTGTTVVWKADCADGGIYVAIFNLNVQEAEIEVTFDALEIEGEYEAYDLWTHKNKTIENKSIVSKVPTHGCSVYKLTLK